MRKSKKALAVAAILILGFCNVAMAQGLIITMQIENPMADVNGKRGRNGCCSYEVNNGDNGPLALRG